MDAIGTTYSIRLVFCLAYNIYTYIILQGRSEGAAQCSALLPSVLDRRNILIKYVYVTDKGHCFIAAVNGGYIERKDDGSFFTASEMLLAMQHRIDAIVKRRRIQHEKQVRS